ncbi:MAG: iron-sulfur cluster assembly accessory protein [Deltaproteobacteria bacterium]|nr:iron-sulfur cluster assembly accessory protein [Deltaproteobacteria bacterium]
MPSRRPSRIGANTALRRQQSKKRPRRPNTAVAVTLSDNAISKIRQLVGEKLEAGLRVKVVGGGCSGLQYRMEIDSAKERDKIFERDGARLIVDKKSFLYLNGSELDYAEELMSSGFRLINPNVKRSCGCGESFTV